MWDRPWFRFLAYVVGAALALGLLYVARVALLPFGISLLIAYLLSPLIEGICRWGVRRSLAVIALVAAFLLAGALAVGITVPLLIVQISDLAIVIPDYLGQIQSTLIPWIEETFQVVVPDTFEEVIEQLRKHAMTEDSPLPSLSPLGEILAWSASSIVNLVTVVLNLVLIPVFTFYLLLDLPELTAFMRGLVPLPYREGASRIGTAINDAIAGFVRGQLTVMVILAVCYCTALYLGDVPLWLLIGLFAGAVSFVPYLGAIFGFGPGVVMAYVEHGDWQHPLFVLAAFAVIQFAEGNIITPKVVGDNLGLHPVAVMMALLLAAQLMGFVGLFIAVPLAAVAKVLFHEVMKLYVRTDFYTGGEDPPPPPQDLVADAEG